MRWGTVSLVVLTCLSSINPGDFFVKTNILHVERGRKGQQHCSSSSKLRRPPSHHRRGQPLRVGNWFEQLWKKPAPVEDKTANEVDILKRQLLDALQPTQRGITTTLEQRAEIDRLIEALKPFNPNPGRASGNSLSALWFLQWTTEKEIIFLMEKGLLDLPSGPVQQNIDLESGAFSNTMLFGPDSFLNVSSSIALEDNGRVSFEFNACKLKYKGLVLPLPPVGKGWFQSIYLDSDLRVTTDIRGDVSVLTKDRS